MFLIAATEICLSTQIRQQPDDIEFLFVLHRSRPIAPLRCVGSRRLPFGLRFGLAADGSRFEPATQLALYGLQDLRQELPSAVTPRTSKRDRGVNIPLLTGLADIIAISEPLGREHDGRKQPSAPLEDG